MRMDRKEMERFLDQSPQCLGAIADLEAARSHLENAARRLKGIYIKRYQPALIGTAEMIQFMEQRLEDHWRRQAYETKQTIPAGEQ